MSNLRNEHVEDGLLLQVLDEELPPRQVEQVNRHIAQCSDCRARLERLRLVTSRVAEYHHEVLSTDAAVAAAERLKFMERLERAAAEPRQRWTFGFGIPVLWQKVAWCGALSLVVLAGLSIWRWHSRPAVLPVVSLTVGPQPAAPVAPPAKQLAARVAPERAKRPARRAPKKSRVPPTDLNEKTGPQVVASEEITTPFFALPFSDAALPLDQAGVIRVELPRSALTLTGLPVDENRRNERVHADLIVGVDGLARAIRFVR